MKRVININRKTIEILCCIDHVHVILEFTLLVTSAVLTTAEIHSREDDWKENGEVTINN